MDYKDEKIELNIPSVVEVQDYEVGVLICRFQVPELHPVHRQLIDTVTGNHKKVILFLGVPIVQQTQRNPLDFASRKAMIQHEYPDITVLPLQDQRNNQTWSYKLDEKISEPYGSRKTLLYGGRDSFIPYYHGRHQTVELIGNNDAMSGTEIRKEVAREVVNSVDFRKGAIYANFGRYPNIWPCADVVVYDASLNRILLGRKGDEEQFRFIGGHIDGTDASYEAGALRELHEEAGNIAVGSVDDAQYICSGKIKDWRHAKEDSEIFSTLFLFTKKWGSATAADDIEEVKWFQVEDMTDYEQYSKLIVPEHVDFFGKLIAYFERTNIINKKTDVDPFLQTR